MGTLEETMKLDHFPPIVLWAESEEVNLLDRFPPLGVLVDTEGPSFLVINPFPGAKEAL